MKRISTLSLGILLFAFSHKGNAQGILNKIKVYFNNPVDNSFSNNGINAIYVKNAIMDTIAAYINRAKYTVDIAQYDYTSYSGDTLSHIATAVNNAYARGVKVRWIYDGSSPNSGLSELNSSIPTLASPTGGNYNISHNKFVIIDEFDSLHAIVSDGSEDWSKWMNDFDYNNILFIQSKVLARAFTNEFNIMWGDTAHGTASNAANSKFGIYKPNSGTHTFTIGGSTVELYFSPSDGTNNQVINTINSATTDMYCAMYDFTQTAYSTAYTGRISAGVYASCILDQYSVGSSAYPAMSATANFAEYTGSQIYHNKYITIDPSNSCSDPMVLTGSMNWTAAGYDENDENIIIIHNDTIANLYLQAFAKDYEIISGGSTLNKIKNCPAGINPVDKNMPQLNVFPNPFNSSTTINYTPSTNEKITVEVFNLMGQKVSTLTDETVSPSDIHSFIFKSPCAGVYILRISEGDNTYESKLVSVY